MRRAATLLRHGAQLCQKLPVDLGQALPTAVRSAGEPCTSTAATTLWTRIFDRQRRPFSAGAASAAGELLIDDSAVKVRGCGRVQPAAL